MSAPHGQCRRGSAWLAWRADERWRATGRMSTATPAQLPWSETLMGERQFTRSWVRRANCSVIVHRSGSDAGFRVWMDQVMTSVSFATYTLHAFASDACMALLPAIVSSVS